MDSGAQAPLTLVNMIGIRALTLCLVAALPIAAAADVRVIDGDTLDLDGTIIRLEGIDAPELDQTCDGWDCGKAATEELVEITKGRDISCVGHGRDDYGRVIATCHAGGVDLGETLVDKGLALAFRRYSDSYTEVEARARDARAGMWRGRFEAPWDFRARQWDAAQQTAPEGCPIKGNISKNGRIYHMPWSKWYARTRIDPSKGERWFCDENEAQAAGWRAPYSN